jgi:large subunit ribosomal protein L25
VEQFELNATVRTRTGNGPARSLRRQGMVPAVLYGPAMQPIPLTVNLRDLEPVVQKGNIRRTIFSVVVKNGGSQTKSAVIKELQTHPVTGRVLHVDFYEIDMQRKLRVMVPVVPRGKAKGEEFGGMLQIIEREIEVLCLPGEIPEALEIDVTELAIGSTLHVKDIRLPSGVELPPGDNYTIITVVGAQVEEVPVPVVGEVAEEEGAEPAAEAEKEGE